jgi:hypothetical protein
MISFSQEPLINGFPKPARRKLPPVPLAAVPKLTPRVALVQLDSVSSERLRKAFEQCGIETITLADDYAERLIREKFEGCVVRLDDCAITIIG